MTGQRKTAEKFPVANVKDVQAVAVHIHTVTKKMKTKNNIFERSEMLLGTENMEKLKKSHVAVFGIGGVGGYMTMNHIQERVAIWKDPFADAGDMGYQIVQSLYAMASGGFMGSGLGQGSPDLIPVVKSDFIFSAIYEEFGMLGATAVIMLFFLLVYRGIKISLRCTNTFNKALTLGLSLMFGFQTFIIIGGVTKFIPMTGITLPFMSAGGSSLAASFIALAILQAVSGRKEDLSDDI